MTLGQLWTFLGIALPALAALLVPMPAVDLAYQLRAGSQILAGDGIPTVDTWTFTAAGTPWLDQQWGAQVVLAAVYQVAGWTGLALLRAGLVAGTFALVTAALRSLGCGPRPAALLSLGSFVVAAPALALRPQLLGIVLFAATLWLLVERARHRGRLWLIPLLALAWANVHGSFPFVLVLVGLAALDDVARMRRPPSHLLAVAIVSSAVTLLNPFGVDVWRYVADLAANPTVSRQVSEWRPPSPLDPVGLLFFASVAAAAAAVLLRLRADGRVGAEAVGPLAMLVVFGGLGLLTGRGLAWWALVLPVAGVELTRGSSIGERLRGWPKPARAMPASGPPEREGSRSPLNVAVVAVLALAGVALLPLWRPVGAAGVPVGTLTHAPQGIAAELRTWTTGGGDTINVWAPQAWGSWLELAAPNVRVATDSRIELLPAKVWPEARLVERAEGSWEEIVAGYGVDAIVLARSNDIQTPAIIDGTPGWSRAYEDVEGIIWIRERPAGP